LDRNTGRQSLDHVHPLTVSLSVSANKGMQATVYGGA